MKAQVLFAVDEHLKLASAFPKNSIESILNVANLFIQTVHGGGAIYWCGNGGSAADSQHLAAELIGRFKRERKAIRSAALTTDTSILTALGNDYSFDEIFARQVEGLVRENDVVVGISTSGNSRNVLLALEKTRTLGGKTVGLLGRDGGAIKHKSDLTVIVPSNDTARIQEMHIMIGHIVCDLVEQAVAA